MKPILSSLLLLALSACGASPLDHTPAAGAADSGAHVAEPRQPESDPADSGDGPATGDISPETDTCCCEVMLTMRDDGPLIRSVEKRTSCGANGRSEYCIADTCED